MKRSCLTFTLAIGVLACAAARARAQARDDDERMSFNADEAAEADEAAASAPPHTRQRALELALQRYRREPRVEDVVRAALAAAPRGQADALAARARTAGWIPRIGLRARRGQTLDLSSSADVGSTDLRLKSNDDLTLEASLNFELDRVVFRPEEVALARQNRVEHADRSALVRDVIHLYYERRRLQLERDLTDTANPARELRIAEIEALLDAFTSGGFRRMIAASRWTTAAGSPATRSPSPPSSTSRAASTPSSARPATSPKAAPR
jgi:hypothetical protein